MADLKVELISNFKTKQRTRMKKSRFTESQIVAAIKKQEAGTSVKELTRELGISEATFYQWTELSMAALK